MGIKYDEDNDDDDDHDDDDDDEGVSSQKVFFVGE